jgi:hypothetical protein
MDVTGVYVTIACVGKICQDKIMSFLTATFKNAGVLCYTIIVIDLSL